MDIITLYNVGPTSAARLRAVGIRTVADLETVGPVAAFRAVREAGHRPSMNLLWALAGGLRGEDWRRVPTAVKVRLTAELKSGRRLRKRSRGK